MNADCIPMATLPNISEQVQMKSALVHKVAI